MYSNSSFQHSILNSASSSSSSSFSSTSNSNLLSLKDQESLHLLIKLFFYKTCHLISIFRSPSSDGNNLQNNNIVDVGSYALEGYCQWFNVKLSAASIPKQALAVWESKRLSDSDELFPPLVLESYLDLRNIAQTSKKLYIKDENNTDWIILKFGQNKKTKSEIVLERWLVELTDENGGPVTKSSLKTGTKTQSLPSVYQNCSANLKALIKTLNTQPCTVLKNRIEQETPELLNVNYRVLDPQSKISSKGRIGLSKPISSCYETNSHSGRGASHILKKEFEPIKTPFGNISITSTYRKDCCFHLGGDRKPATPSDYKYFILEEAPLSSATVAPVNIDGGLLARCHSLLKLRKASTNSVNSLFSSKGNSPKTNGSLTLTSPPKTPLSYYSYTDKNINKGILPDNGNTDATKLGTNNSPTNNSSTSINSVPNFDRSNSNVSLAAILRAQRNSFSNPSVPGVKRTPSTLSNNTSSSQKPQISPSSTGASLSNTDEGAAPVAIPIKDSFGNTGSATGTGVRYSSSFSSSKYRHKSSFLVSEPESRPLVNGNFSLNRNSLVSSRDILARNSSYESIGNGSQGQTPSKDNDLLLSDYSLGEFLDLIDFDKFKFKPSYSNGPNNKENILHKYHLMKPSNDELTSSLSSSFLVEKPPGYSNKRSGSSSTSSSRRNSHKGPVFPPSTSPGPLQFTAAVKNHLAGLETNRRASHGSKNHYRAGNNSAQSFGSSREPSPSNFTALNDMGYGNYYSFPNTPRFAKRLSFASSTHSLKYPPKPIGPRAFNGNEDSLKLSSSSGASSSYISQPLIEANVNNVYAKIESISQTVNVNGHSGSTKVDNKEHFLLEPNLTYSDSVGEELLFEDY